MFAFVFFLSYFHLLNDLFRMTECGKIFPVFEVKILYKKLSFCHEPFSSRFFFLFVCFLSELAKRRLKSPFAQSVISARENRLV